jgi:hypothetical protein
LLALKRSLAGALAVTVLVLLTYPSTAPAACGPYGGVSPGSGECAATPTVAGPKAKLINGMAVAPASAPPGVKKVIEAANKIRTKPYVWGGGHGRWWDEGYDCSGAVSYALRGAKLLTSPLDSTGLMSWGAPNVGRWITVYANGGHTYAVIAGLRWDTAGSAKGTGPRWYADTRSAVPGKFAVRHPIGY